MKTQKIITLAVSLFVCSGFATAEVMTGLTKGLIKRTSKCVKIQKFTPKQWVEGMAGVRNGTIVPKVSRLAKASRQLAKMRADLNNMPQDIASQVQLPTPEKLAEEMSSGVRTYQLNGESPVLPQQDALLMQSLRNKEMPIHWNPEKGYLETTDGHGNVVPFDSLSKEEQRVRWVQQQERTSLSSQPLGKGAPEATELPSHITMQRLTPAQQLEAMAGVGQNGVVTTLPTYRLNGESPVLPEQDALVAQYLRDKEMPIRWNPEKGYLETTDGHGNVVPFHSLSKEEQRVRWAQQQGRTLLSLGVNPNPEVVLPVNGHSILVDSRPYVPGEDCTSLLGKNDYYFFNWKIQLWMYHHRNGKVTYQEQFFTGENGEPVLAVEDKEAFSGWLEGEYSIFIPSFKHGKVNVFTHHSDGTITYKKTEFPPEWMKPIFEPGGKISLISPAD